MKTTAAEKRVINVLKYNEGSYISVGYNSHRVVSNDHRKLIAFNEVTLIRLHTNDLIYGAYPKFYLKNK